MIINESHRTSNCPQAKNPSPRGWKLMAKTAPKTERFGFYQLCFVPRRTLSLHLVHCTTHVKTDKYFQRISILNICNGLQLVVDEDSKLFWIFAFGPLPAVVGFDMMRFQLIVSVLETSLFFASFTVLCF